MAHSRHGLVEVGQVLLRGMEKQDGGSLGTQRPIPGGTARLRARVERGCQDLAGRPGPCPASPKGASSTWCWVTSWDTSCCSRWRCTV